MVIALNPSHVVKKASYKKVHPPAHSHSHGHRTTINCVQKLDLQKKLEIELQNLLNSFW